jgi:hypothetical protein
MTTSILSPLNSAAERPVADLIDRVEQAVARLKARGVADGEVAAVVRRIVHSPAVAMLVRLTPNPADDAALEILKALFPLSA